MSTAPVVLLHPALSSPQSAVGTRQQPRLRLTRRGRAVLTTLAAMPLVVAALAFALNGGVASASAGSGDASSATVEVVTVSGGESLWQLAESLAPSEDTREVVAQLLKFNSLASADVYPGQQLAVPTQYQ